MLLVILRKLTQGLLMLIAVSAISFALLSTAGGDALSALRESPTISEKTINELAEHYGLDRPLPVRYVSWLGSAVRGDLGESIAFKTPVATLVWSKFANTALIGLTALGFAIGIAFLLGIASARSNNGLLSAVADGIVVIFASIPAIVLAVAALVITATVMGGINPTPGVISSQFFLGALGLGLPFTAILLSQLRNGLVETLGEDYVQLARAKGLSDRTVLLRHALRGALNPFLTVTGLLFGTLLSGAVIVESVMGWPGLGPLLVAAVKSRDIPLVMGIVVVSSIVVWLGNTAAEVLHVLNDRRILAQDTLASTN